METSNVIRFEGTLDNLVWRYSEKEIVPNSQLIVDEAHQALLLVNRMVSNLFEYGKYMLDDSIIDKLFERSDKKVFSNLCEVFFVQHISQKELKWNTDKPLVMNDPIYDVFLLHITMNGRLDFSIVDPIIFLEKWTGFQDQYNCIDMERDLSQSVSSWVKEYIYKIMTKGIVSYFQINKMLLDINAVIESELKSYYSAYGICIDHFKIENIFVPEKDYHGYNLFS